ncbi:hypothetical protein K0M31_008434 [Melipona bicolor]|uniref:Uncharacterized protein n=1 Tax=Melipona bicolor TaxID=60889 RepID=A0AA40FQZ6_9HYME|nr:hypothetical protein K0M31_008434 [Melipona bicolor]
MNMLNVIDKIGFVILEGKSSLSLKTIPEGSGMHQTRGSVIDLRISPQVPGGWKDLPLQWL